MQQAARLVPVNTSRVFSFSNMISTPTTKRCRDCKTNKSTSEFHKLKTRPDGLAIRCKSCTIERLNPYTARLAKAKQLESGARYSIVRNTSRRTGQCNWGIWDSRPYDGNPVCYVADNLKAQSLNAIDSINRLKSFGIPSGQIGFVTNDDVEDAA